MQIRTANLSDLEAIQRLNNNLFELELKNFDPYLTKNWPLLKEGKKYFKQSIKNDYVIVATENNIVIGYLLGCITNIPYYNFKIAELCNMCVEENFRKCGIGTKLFKEFEKHFNLIGITHFIVTASYKNTSAKAFYKKIGFNESNTTFIKV